MYIVFFITGLLFLLIVGSITFLVLNKRDRKNEYTKYIVVGIPSIMLLAFGLTYLPHTIVNIDPSNVSRITVFDGSTGHEIEIVEKVDIKHIIGNLNKVTFQKGKSSFGLMGFRFRTTIYNQKNKPIKELIINSNETVRYKGFLYTAKHNSIDAKYIEKLYNY